MIPMKEKVILAYSGGLDTTAIIPWLKENYDYEVICCCVNCGQDEELDGLEERAKLSGATKLYIEDITDEFCDDYIVPCVQANAVYENKYLLGTSMARPGIAKKLVEIARKEGATAICHGATGKGNDQIRFELGIKALAPDGIMLSNGPGDPKENVKIIAEVKKLTKSGIPIFGICLGHQLLALASGADTTKLKYGHRGANQPVKDLETGRVYISSQNHGYAVKNESLPKGAQLSQHQRWNLRRNHIYKVPGIQRAVPS